MSSDLLERIQSMQFKDQGGAEALLLSFLRETFPQLNITTVTLRPQAVSLNSFNGFLAMNDGTRLFFKTHVETGNVVGEYYNAAMLADAGYPVLQPLYSSTRYGQHLLIYPVMDSPTVFDAARAIEDTDTFDSPTAQALTAAQQASDDQLHELYAATLTQQLATEAAAQPVHQLFHHRLAGERYRRFYGQGQTITLPHGQTLSFAALAQYTWTINGAHYSDTLTDIIARALHLLNPAQPGPSIIGHGDAHNGNVFFTDEGLVYFDPAFAGRHHPLLDLTKPLFHNAFAMWMYFPEAERGDLSITLNADGRHMHVTHNYDLNALRHMFLESKVQRVLLPILQQLKDHDQLRRDWRAYLKSALFACPFLTLDLKRFPPEITLLGLTMAVQMGAESQGERSRIDRVLDDTETVLR